MINRKIDQSRYSFVETDLPEGKTSGIRLNDEEFMGFVYTYGSQIKFGENDNPDGTRDLQFTYDVLQWGTLIEEDLNKIEFKRLLGDILTDLISEQLDTNPDTIKIVSH